MFKECLLFTRPLDLNLQHENIGEENTLFPYLTDSISKKLIIKTSLFKGKKKRESLRFAFHFRIDGV